MFGQGPENDVPNVRQAVGMQPADGFAVCASVNYRISKIKYAISMMAVTLAMESTKASLASL